MTVKELRAKLAHLPDNTIVLHEYDGEWQAGVGLYTATAQQHGRYYEKGRNTDPTPLVHVLVITEPDTDREGWIA